MIDGLPAVGLEEIATAALVIIAVALLGRFLGVVKKLVANSIAGLVVLFGAQALGVSVAYTPLNLAIAALAGLPGGILVVLLSVMGIQIVPPQELESVLEFLLLEQ